MTVVMDRVAIAQVLLRLHETDDHVVDELRAMLGLERDECRATVEAARRLMRSGHDRTRPTPWTRPAGGQEL